jgi:hypothetical protein
VFGLLSISLDSTRMLISFLSPLADEDGIELGRPY